MKIKQETKNIGKLTAITIQECDTEGCYRKTFLSVNRCWVCRNAIEQEKVENMNAELQACYREGYCTKCGKHVKALELKKHLLECYGHSGR